MILRLTHDEPEKDLRKTLFSYVFLFLYRAPRKKNEAISFRRDLRVFSFLFFLAFFLFFFSLYVFLSVVGFLFIL